MGVYKLSAAGGLATPRTNYSSFLAGNPAVTFTSYESIATVTVGSGGAADVTFSSIPSTYKHLQIRAIARSTRASGVDDMSIKVNGSSSNGSSHILYGTGSSASAAGYTGYIPFVSYFPTAGTGSNVFSAIVIDILDYTDTNKYKTLRTFTGFDNNGSGYISLNSNLALDTTAISSIVFLMNNGNIVEYSQFALYGIKGS